MSDPYDVVVIGGGPAGTTLASLVQRKGYRCLILERATFPRYHVGESLIPHTYGTLSRLGLLTKLRASNFPVKHSVRFVSADGKRSTPFYFSETIEGECAQTCHPLRERLVEAERVDSIRGSRRLAYVNRQTCGDGWLMLGDARAFLDPIYSSGLYLALASAELAADCVIDALAEADYSISRLSRFEPRLMAGIDVIQRLIHAFYDSEFSFGAFLKRFPEQRVALIDCLVGDVLDKNLASFKEALAQMTVPPQPLTDAKTE